MAIAEQKKSKGKAKKAGYSGIYNCHKYWGKKPYELCELILGTFAGQGDAVLDPFLGSGVMASAAKAAGINFSGCDLNPAAVDIARMFVDPPSGAQVQAILKKLSTACERDIELSYTLKDGRLVSHLIWTEGSIDDAWVVDGIRTQSIDPTDEMYALASVYDDYLPAHFVDRELQRNSRINVDTGQHVSDLFTTRALRNIDLLLGAIRALPPNERRIASFILSSALGQMSKMVFAIAGRRNSSTKGGPPKRFEVGSWVIGFWRPKQYFEIDVWHVFKGRAKRLLSAVSKTPELFNQAPLRASTTTIECNDALTYLLALDEESIDLIVTDPPHSDRIPYLELSEMWNAFLNYDSNFEKEFIYSNAKFRNMGQANYIIQFDAIICQAARVLKSGGHFILMFNTTDQEVWDSLQVSTSKESNALEYMGKFSAEYSAGSVVQDSRAGALKNDWCLVFKKRGETKSIDMSRLPRWSSDWVRG